MIDDIVMTCRSRKTQDEKFASVAKAIVAAAFITAIAVGATLGYLHP